VELSEIHWELKIGRFHPYGRLSDDAVVSLRMGDEMAQRRCRDAKDDEMDALWWRVEVAR
jgi:hypothetical protein